MGTFVAHSIGAQASSENNEVQIESTVISISQSKFEPGCFQARVKILHRPYHGVDVVHELLDEHRPHVVGGYPVETNQLPVETSA